ncbi:hypothetical protein KSS87_002746, partial [Heliosperma pusillum]
ERFLYPRVLQKWILKSIGHKWRDYKCTLKGIHYSDDENITELHNNCPEDVVHDQWISLVNFWRSDEGQERSRKSILSHKKAKTKPLHTSGTKIHARVSEDLKKALQRSPTRTELYLECHQHKKEANITDQIKEIAAQQGHIEGNLNDDPVAQVLGKDQYGRVRGIGLGVKPSDLTEPSDPHYCRGLNMSTNEETTTMYLIRQLKEQMQTLEKRVIKQGNTINKQRYTISKLKRKLRNDDDFDIGDDNSDECSFEGGCDNDADEELQIPDTDDEVSF